MTTIAPTERTRVNRLPNRGVYDREAIYAILDEAFICHVGFVVDGKPVVIPTGYGRCGNTLYIHGSSASRMLRTLKEGVDVCVTVTLLDGLVLARSAFHHSVNYRSVVVFGKASLVESDTERWEALRVVTDHIVPDRWAQVREPNAQELKATAVLSIKLDEASAKVRTGNPVDDEEDYALPVWAGVVPVKTVFGEPMDDARLNAGLEPPENIAHYDRRRGVFGIKEAVEAIGQ